MIKDILASLYGKYAYQNPLYNIIKKSDSEYDIEVALAGYEYENINVTLHHNELTIEAKTRKRENVEYLHHDIPDGPPWRKFDISNELTVTGCDFVNGLLTVHLEQMPAQETPQIIPIR